ncbi:PAS domain S-box protein [Ensifer sp. SL37]|uniref:PAS domain S-box protein n=1 Tax=Ensifer sp. SL37 TaxID=2995137 RepID=UPI002274046E|nr:PAS domain S-box protein [Ensifer sp. SL37]MCY1745874.1 PAS domain S-box protein [Ensifer sp. SL37]
MEPDFGEVLNAIPSIVFTVGADGRVDFVNGRWEEYTGLRWSARDGWRWEDVVEPDDLAVLSAKFRASSEGSSRCEVRLRGSDGNFRWFVIDCRPLSTPLGAPPKWCAIATDIEDQRKAAEALLESQKKLQLIVNSLPGLIIVLRADGSVETVNDQSLRFFGYDFAEHQRWQTNDIIHPDDRARAVAKFAEAVAIGQSYEVIERLRRYDGVYRWFQVRGNPVAEDDGTIVRWYFLLNDIDDRVRAEKALAESEREFRHIVNMVPGMIILSRPDGTLDGSNQQLLDYFGITLNEVQDWATNGITHPDDVQVNIDTFIGSLKSGEPYDYESRYRRHDGVFRWFQVRAQPLRDAEGIIVRWYGLLTDIDDRKNVEEELKRSQAFLAAGQAVSSTGTFSWNVQTDELRLSEEWLKIFELEGEEVTLERIRQRVHPDDLAFLAEKMSSVREVGGTLDYELRLLSRDGTIKHIRVISQAIDHQDGHRESLGAIQDVTQKRQIEEATDQLRGELARLTGFLSLGQMSAAIAHEVNQPISRILTNASTCLRMLSTDPPDVATALETVRRTIRDANRATEVITRLRALFGNRAISFKELDLHDAVREVTTLLASEQRRNGVVIRTAFAPDLPLVNGDRVQLQQVVSNLIRNAIDAVKEVRDRLKMIEISTRVDQDGFVSLAVADNGVGIDTDSASRIYEPFYTTKADGMGIGLTICRSIVETHGGKLWMEANIGPGVTVHFSVPTCAVKGEVSSASK